MPLFRQFGIQLYDDESGGDQGAKALGAAAPAVADAGTALIDGFGAFRLVWSLPDAGTSCDFRVYVYDEESALWLPQIRLGVAGLIAAATGDAAPFYEWTMEQRPKWLHVEIDNSAGVFTTGLSAWLEGWI